MRSPLVVPGATMPGGGEAAIPSVVRGVAAHRLGGVAAHANAGDRALRAQQVVGGLGADVEDVVFEVVPEAAVGRGSSRTFWPFVKIVRRRRWWSKCLNCTTISAPLRRP
jgi:hypothetical protein